MRRIALVLAAVLICVRGEAQAVEYRQVVAEKSSIAFAYRQMNVPMEGAFKRFAGQINFDPAKLVEASARFDIDLTSIDTGASDSDEEVQRKPWFNTRVFPQAQFVSSSIKAVRPNVFDVSGRLTIKGKASDVHTLVSMKQAGAKAVFEGALAIRRADFAIGEGMWADFGTVANEVQIKFRILATAEPVAGAKKQ